MYVLVQYIMYTCSRISIILLTLMNHQKELHNVKKLIKGYCQLVGCGLICGTRLKKGTWTTVSVTIFLYFNLKQ